MVHDSYEGVTRSQPSNGERRSRPHGDATCTVVIPLDALIHCSAIGVSREGGHYTMCLPIFTTMQQTITHATSHSSTAFWHLDIVPSWRDVKLVGPGLVPQVRPAEHNDCTQACTTDEDATCRNTAGDNVYS